ncbi:hypothetical protein ACE6H2_016091 [Prunus campanulata]
MSRATSHRLRDRRCRDQRSRSIPPNGPVHIHPVYFIMKLDNHQINGTRQISFSSGSSLRAPLFDKTPVGPSPARCSAGPTRKGTEESGVHVGRERRGWGIAKMREAWKKEGFASPNSRGPTCLAWPIRDTCSPTLFLFAVTNPTPLWSPHHTQSCVSSCTSTSRHPPHHNHLNSSPILARLLPLLLSLPTREEHIPAPGQ